MKSLASILIVAGSAAALAGAANAQPGWGGPRAVLFDQPNFQGRSITVVEGSPNLSSWGFAARAMSARFEGDWTVCDAPNLDGRCATVRGDVADLTQVGLRGIVSLGDGATEAQSDGHHEAAAAMTDAAVRSDQQVAAATEDEQVPGARFGARRQAYDAPPPPAPPTGPAPVAATQFAAAGPPLAATPVAPPAPIAPGSAEAPRQQLVAYAGPPAAGPATPGMAQSVQSDAGHSAVFFAKPTRGGAEVAIDAQGPANQFCHDQGLGPAVYFDTDGHTLRDVLCRRP